MIARLAGVVLIAVSLNTILARRRVEVVRERRAELRRLSHCYAAHLDITLREVRFEDDPVMAPCERARSGCVGVVVPAIGWAKPDSRSVSY